MIPCAPPYARRDRPPNRAAAPTRRAARSPYPAAVTTEEHHRYDGTQTTDIKVGTIHRAKGMDFTAVFLLTKQPPTNLADLTPAARDQAELQARQHLVAASRARDYLWVGLLTD
ncbi:3'-5' exonuclease [Nocardia asteroides]|uniref:3'-5' exonuclease n=1 Tax=Nocardia asteroides TaxID=1824 RepID=UPI0033D23C7A